MSFDEETCRGCFGAGEVIVIYRNSPERDEICQECNGRGYTDPDADRKRITAQYLALTERARAVTIESVTALGWD